MSRVLDILLSGMALLMLSPILVPVVLILRFSGEGEVFFVQERIGEGGKPFNLFKFATMLKDSPSLGTGTITVKNDPRILPFGRVLRKTKVNELPQLLNILLGHMSVVGPRPLTAQAFSNYSDTVQKEIIRVRPGLSGVGSIVFRNEEELLSRGLDSTEMYRDLVAPYKGALETWFVKNNGIYVYLTCILVTIVAVISSNSRLVWKVFPDLPAPPEELRFDLGYAA